MNTEPPANTQPPAGPPPSAARPPRLLRRSRRDRFGVGVCGGLGEYFGVDPVIFRVVLAVLTVFGGAGVLLYLLLWAAIPEEGTSRSALDRGIAELRRRRVPFGVVAAIVVIGVWAIGFSWWAPHALIPAIVVTAILLVIVSRRRHAAERTDPAVPAAPEPAEAAPGSYYANVPASADPTRPWAAPLETDPTVGSQLREWISESRARSRERHRRTFPIRAAVLGIGVATLAALAILDAVSGIRFATYFWAAGIIVGAALVVGLVTRRTPWSLTPLLVPVIAGLVAFGSSPMRLHDGAGDRAWQPTSTTQLQDRYRQAFGQSTLDLTDVPAVAADRTVRIELGAGRIHLIVPRSLAVEIHTDVHFGQVELDGVELHAGYNFQRTVRAPTGATGPVLIIDARLTNGQIDIDRVG